MEASPINPDVSTGNRTKSVKNTLTASLKKASCRKLILANYQRRESSRLTESSHSRTKFNYWNNATLQWEMLLLIISSLWHVVRTVFETANPPPADQQRPWIGAQAPARTQREQVQVILDYFGYYYNWKLIYNKPVLRRQPISYLQCHSELNILVANFQALGCNQIN